MSIMSQFHTHVVHYEMPMDYGLGYRENFYYGENDDYFKDHIRGWILRKKGNVLGIYEIIKKLNEKYWNDPKLLKKLPEGYYLVNFIYWMPGHGWSETHTEIFKTKQSMIDWFKKKGFGDYTEHTIHFFCRVLELNYEEEKEIRWVEEVNTLKFSYKQNNINGGVS